MNEDLKTELVYVYGCPIIDFYSLNETGPIAYSSPENPGYFQQLPNDIFIEILSNDGSRLPFGEAGNICISGGRNPYLPLLRYKTGDRGILFKNDGISPDPSPFLKLLDVRMPVMFQSMSGKRVNSIDIGKILRGYPVFRHQCIQHRNLAITLKLESNNLDYFKDEIMKKINLLFNNEIALSIIDRYDFVNENMQTYIKE